MVKVPTDDDLRPGSPQTLKDEPASKEHNLDPGTGDDDIVVDWDGPDDPMNPKNWGYRKKWAATFAVSSFTFISPVASSMIAPASRQMANEFGIKGDTTIALIVSVYVLAYAFGPLLLGPLSEIYGRSRVLQLANLWFFAWTMGCGFAQNKSQMITFRFLAGLGGSAPLAVGGALLGDCWSAEQRGHAIALYSLAPLLGPVIGPVAGAWVAERSNWRWVFWSTCIADALIQLFGILVLQETFPPVLLERKAQKLRKQTSQEKPRVIRTVFEGGDRHWKQIFSRALTRPFVFFIHEPIIQLLGVYLAFIYGLLYIFLTTIPTIFEGVYNQRVGLAGLHYIALGVGLALAAQVNARTMDRTYQHFKNRNGGIGEPEYRLPSIVPGTILVPMGLLLTGWTTRVGVHWIVPDIGIAFVGAGTILVYQGIQTYVIDAFTLHSASALAAVTFLRSVAGFGFPLFAPVMYKALGFGKGDTILGVIAIVVGCPAPWLFWIYGERIRGASRYARKAAAVTGDDTV